MTPADAEQLAALRDEFPSPEIVAQHMCSELDRLEQTIRRAAPHWRTMLPGRAWTPAQELEHTMGVNEGTARVVRLLASERPIPEVLETEGRWQAGKRLAPAGTEPGGQQSAEDLLAKLSRIREHLTTPVQAAAGRTFRHPFMGPIDALDWLRVGVWHMRGHRQATEAGLEQLGG